MKSVIGLFTSGGAVANLWKSVPAFVKVPAVIGVVVLAGAELTRDVNLGLRSGRVTEGEAVKADAQVVDPVKTRADMQAGKPVSGAERTVAVQYEGLDADARQKQATADAATASEDELLTKAERHERQTSTEKLRLLELQVKAQELAIKEAEARMKSAEATNAEQTAAVAKMVNNWILNTENIKPHGNVARRAANDEFRKLGW